MRPAHVARHSALARARAGHLRRFSPACTSLCVPRGYTGTPPCPRSGCLRPSPKHRHQDIPTPLKQLTASPDASDAQMRSLRNTRRR